MLLTLALSRPAYKNALQKTNIQAQDIIIALDVSFSMRATDLAPDRYTFATKTIEALLKKNPSDNIMLIAFTTNPLLLSPPTTDHALINIALQSLNPKYILTKGTSLERLFEGLEHMHAREKSIILITDGGEESSLSKTQQHIRNAELSLITLGLGSKKGSTIETKDGSKIKDKQGHLVISRLSPLLEPFTKSVQGEFVLAQSTPNATANRLYTLLQEHKSKTHNIQKMQHYYRELYQIPLCMAVVLFLLLHTRGVVYLLLLFSFFGVDVHAAFLDDYYLHTAYTHYQEKLYKKAQQDLQKIEFASMQSALILADSYYQQKTYKKAITLYDTIHTTSASIKQQLYYNIANAYAMQHAYNKAKTYYTKALQLGKDADALYNLKQIVFLHDKKESALGMAHPKSQNSTSSKSQTQEMNKKKKHDENAPSSRSGAGGEKTKARKQEKNRLKLNIKAKPQPLGSKAYELINKGYIYETRPW